MPPLYTCHLEGYGPGGWWYLIGQFPSHPVMEADRRSYEEILAFEGLFLHLTGDSMEAPNKNP